MRRSSWEPSEFRELVKTLGQAMQDLSDRLYQFRVAFPNFFDDLEKTGIPLSRLILSCNTLQCMAQEGKDDQLPSLFERYEAYKESFEDLKHGFHERYTTTSQSGFLVPIPAWEWLSDCCEEIAKKCNKALADASACFGENSENYKTYYRHIDSSRMDMRIDLARFAPTVKNVDKVKLCRDLKDKIDALLCFLSLPPTQDAIDLINIKLRFLSLSEVYLALPEEKVKKASALFELGCKVRHLLKYDIPDARNIGNFNHKITFFLNKMGDLLNRLKSSVPAPLPSAARQLFFNDAVSHSCGHSQHLQVVARVTP